MAPNNGLLWRLSIAVFLLLLAFCPVKTMDAPDWNVCVVDEANQPVRGVLVRESYQNYSAEWQGHEEDQYTDEHGCVHFAPKAAWISPLKRLAVIATSALAGVHASFGPNAYVIAFHENLSGDDVKGGIEYAWKGAPSHVDSTLVLRSH
jgi:hypothetical protein